MKFLNYKFTGILLGGLLSVFLAGSVHAFQVETLTSVAEKHDFVVGPGNIELFVNPGEKVTKQITITNRYGRSMIFHLEKEDFTGNQDGTRLYDLLGVEKGPYSLRDFIHPEISEFRLNHGERARVDITIEVPPDAQPGGLYGALIVTNSPDPLEPESVSGGVVAGGMTIQSRIGVLIFVRVKGDANEDGSLQNFTVGKKIKNSLPAGSVFTTEFVNKGNVHLKPFGLIRVKNGLGAVVDEIEIQPYFVMPGATRVNSYTLNRSLFAGRYTVTIELNRGYDNIVDTKTEVVWVIPWKSALLILAGVIILIIILKQLRSWFKKNFEVKRKGK